MTTTTTGGPTAAKETPVEAKMRKVLVNTAVRHALRCVQVQAEERAALVVQRYWRSYAASRELRRRRWAVRRRRWGEASVAAVVAAPFNLIRAVIRTASFAVWSFLMTFWLARVLFWVVASIPRALFRALVSWEAVVGAAAANVLAARDPNPDNGFRDYFAVYVVAFVVLDMCARDLVVNRVLAAGAAVRRGLREVLRVALMTAAALSPTRAGELAIHRVAKLLGVIEKIPTKHRVMHFKTPPPLVMAPRKKAEDPELIDALRTAELFARESKTNAERLEAKMAEMDAKLQAYAQLSEAQMTAAVEISERASTAVETVMKEASTRLSSVQENTSLVDERIDKRFEDMEAMLREARDEGRAEGVREGADWPGLRLEDDLIDGQADTAAAIERGLREGMERGIMKGIELEKMRKKQKGWKPMIKKMLGMEPKMRKQAAQSRLDELKRAIRNQEIPTKSGE